MKTQESSTYQAPVGAQLYQFATFLNRCADYGKLVLSSVHRGRSSFSADVSRVFVRDECTLIVHEVAGEAGIPWGREIKVWDLRADSFSLKGGPVFPAPSTQND